MLCDLKVAGLACSGVHIHNYDVSLRRPRLDVEDTILGVQLKRMKTRESKDRKAGQWEGNI